MKNKVCSLSIIITITALFILGVTSCKGLKVPEPSYWPTDGWQNANPESQGLDSGKIAEGLNTIKKKNVKIHSLMIIRNDSVILDSYFYPYDGSIYHDVASVTKSIITTLIGIAIDQGKLSLDQPVLSFFPERTIANRDKLKEQVTIRHLVSNSSGFLFEERDDNATICAMTYSDDWVQSTLDLPMIHEPGSHFAYFSPGFHLLSAILQESTGMTALEFADVNLFKPLGIDIDNIYWPFDSQGYNYGWGDLCMYPEDMAKIGFLFLHQGQWEDRQIISNKWIGAATKKQLSTDPGRGEDYGYGWWISRPEEEIQYYRADGRGGQRIIVVPTMNMLLITTGGGFDNEQVDPFVIDSIVDLENPLDPNPSAVDMLDNTVAELKQIPEPQSTSPLPEMANIISGKLFEFEQNDLKFNSFRIIFDNEKEATAQLDGEDGIITAVIGLDGLWRPSISGYPVIMRGSWEDDDTFTFEYNGGPDLDHSKIKLDFENDKVKLEVLIPVIYKGLTIEGNLKD